MVGFGQFFILLAAQHSTYQYNDDNIFHFANLFYQKEVAADFREDLALMFFLHQHIF